MDQPRLQEPVLLIGRWRNAKTQPKVHRCRSRCSYVKQEEPWVYGAIAVNSQVIRGYNSAAVETHRRFVLEYNLLGACIDHATVEVITVDECEGHDRCERESEHSLF